MKFSEKILYCRKKAGLSQEALAEKLGISRQAVSKWETGEADPEMSKLRQLSEIFEVSADWLLSDSPPPADTPESGQTASGGTQSSADYHYGYDAGAHNGTNPGTGTGSAAPKQGRRQSFDDAWMDELPAFLAKLFRRFGWLLGVYIACVGALFTFAGGIARFITVRMNEGFWRASGSLLDGFGGGKYSSEIRIDGDVPPELEGLIRQAIGEQAGPGHTAANPFGNVDLLSGNPVYIMSGILIVLGLVLLAGGIILAVFLYRKSKPQVKS